MKKRFILSLLAAVMLLTLCTVTAGAKSGSALDLAISEPETGNDEFSVKITVQNISETLHVVEYVVAYDSEKLELVNTVDDEGVLDCIPNLPQNWENFAGVEKAGQIKAMALTANMQGLKNGELAFEFKFRVKDGATGKTEISVSDESVLGAYVGTDEITEFGGKGGSVTITLTEDGEVGEVSADTVSLDITDNASNGDSASGGDDGDDEDSSSVVITVSIIVAVVVIVAVAIFFVVKKKK